MARLAAYRNVWWSMADEYDSVAEKTMADWDRYFRIVRASDPYGHLRSVHNGQRLRSQQAVGHAREHPQRHARLVSGGALLARV